MAKKRAIYHDIYLPLRQYSKLTWHLRKYMKEQWQYILYILKYIIANLEDKIPTTRFRSQAHPAELLHGIQR